MTDVIQQKVLDVAVNELTLFKVIKTKKDLLDINLNQNIEKLKKDFGLLLIDKKFETPEDFLKILTKDLAKITEDNFEIIHIALNEKGKVPESIIEEFISSLGEYLEKNIQNSKIDYKAFATTIFAYTYAFSLGKHYGNTFISHDDILEGFINNSILYADKHLK